jgi:hypothetical protein
MSNGKPFPAEVIDLLESYETTPLDAYVQVKNLLMDNCREGGRFDPLDHVDQWKLGRDGYHNAHHWFKEKKWYFASEKLLVEWWNSLGQLQFSRNKRVYRAECAYLLSDLYNEMNEQGLALRWAMLMQADDLLGEHPQGGGAGRQLLMTRMGLSSFAFDELNRISQLCLSTAQKEGWEKPVGFAEEVLCKFAQSKAGYVIAETFSVKEFPVSQGYFNALYKQANDSNGARSKGVSLEDLALYLLMLLPGCVPHKNVLAEQRMFESDVLIHNLSPASTVITDLFGRHFLIECKNRKEKADSAIIGYFLYRMKLTHTRFGIIFSKSGITGGKNHEAAHELTRRAFHEDHLICVLISNEDLEKFGRGTEINFWWLLLEKIEALRFGKPRTKR